MESGGFDDVLAWLFEPLSRNLSAYPDLPIQTIWLPGTGTKAGSPDLPAFREALGYRALLSW